MAREWYHYPGGIKTAWPENTPPHADSVYRADFLNQFVDWGNYLHAIGGSQRPSYSWPERRTAPIIAGQTIIQTADFWNSLAFWPSDNFLMLRYFNYGAGTKINGWKISINNWWGLPQIIRMQPGDIIYPGDGICSFCLSLRRRLDACQVAKRNSGLSFGGGWVEWRTAGDGSSYSEQSGTQDFPILFWYAADSANHPGGRECRNYWLSNIHLVAERCGAALISYWEESEYEPFFPTPWLCPDDHTSAYIIASSGKVDCRNGWMAVAGDFGKADAPTFIPLGEAKRTYGSLAMLCFPLDAIPPP